MYYMEKKTLILLTGTINPEIFRDKQSGNGINVVLTDSNLRLQQYCSVIERFIRESIFDYIVFVENSDFPFDARKYEEISDLQGKKFEFLRCPLSADEIAWMREKGKSFGEGKLISYAIDNSRLISQVETVYKITGRVFLENSKQIVAKSQKDYNEFISKNNIAWSNTEFFKVKVEDFKKYFRGHELEADDFAERSIERVYYTLMKKNGIKCKAFRVYPKLHGRVASTVARNYDKSGYQLFLCNLASRFGFFDLK